MLGSIYFWGVKSVIFVILERLASMDPKEAQDPPQISSADRKACLFGDILVTFPVFWRLRFLLFLRKPPFKGLGQLLGRQWSKKEPKW